MKTPIALICKMLFPSISTFETPPDPQGRERASLCAPWCGRERHQTLFNLGQQCRFADSCRAKDEDQAGSSRFTQGIPHRLIGLLQGRMRHRVRLEVVEPACGGLMQQVAWERHGLLLGAHARYSS